MVLRLGRSVNVERDIPVGYGVVFRMAPFGFADYKRIQAAADRIARETAPAIERIELDAIDEEDIPPESEDDLKARFSEALLIGLLLAYGRGWTGLVLESEEDPGELGAPEIQAPFTRERIEQFLESFPGVALQLEHKVLAPYQEMISEGKEFAPSPSTATQAD
jgi:hypothetical protein